MLSQPDPGSAHTVIEAPFELTEISQATIKQAINAIADSEIVMSTQNVLDRLKELCTQQVVNPEQIDATLEVDIHLLCETHPNISKPVFRELLSNDF